MDHLTINIPDGLSDEQKAALAARLSRIAERFAPRDKRGAHPSLVDLAGALRSEQPVGSKADERAAAWRDVVKRATRENA